jgi:large subunit ribosomal protein L10
MASIEEWPAQMVLPESGQPGDGRHRSCQLPASVYVRVVKNTLARRAVEGTEFACLQESLKGPLLLAFSREDPGAAARVFKDFAKTNEKLVTKAVAIGGVLYGPADLERLASLPTLNQARAMLLGVLQAPAVKLVRTLAEPAALVARVLAARGKAEEAA